LDILQYHGERLDRAPRRPAAHALGPAPLDFDSSRLRRSKR
jgi:hypothetical protein